VGTHTHEQTQKAGNNYKRFLKKIPIKTGAGRVVSVGTQVVSFPLYRAKFILHDKKEVFSGSEYYSLSSLP